MSIDLVPRNLGPLPCPGCTRLRAECMRQAAEIRELRANLRQSGYWQDKLADKIVELDTALREAKARALPTPPAGKGE